MIEALGSPGAFFVPKMPLFGLKTGSNYPITILENEKSSVSTEECPLHYLVR